MIYGLIGKRLGHSFSREIHGRLSSDPYELRELAPSELPGFLRERDFRGINVTIPYKQAVMPHLDVLDESAVRSGAVNTIVNRDGKLYGYNTDFDGFIMLARHASVDFRDAGVVILGAGGAAKAVAAAARSMGAASVRNAVRTPRAEGQLPITDIAAFKDCDILVNATPVGMYPDWQGRLVDLDSFPRLRGVLDCIYNPLWTSLVLDARERGIAADGGLYMLVGQAIKARELFAGETYSGSDVEMEFRHLMRSKRNIVLCGMPSCGKSTVGSELARYTGRRFVDTDEIVALQAGMEIPDIFSREGEAAFRLRETAAIESIAPEQGLVVATGGGAVLSETNCRLLRHNGILILLNRDPELLVPTADRPLSRSREELMALYSRRMPLYAKAADFIISNNGPVEHTVYKLIEYAV
ncbi:MAG: hypothetical protein J5640_05370 [Bacteroidales bacterium]|nr:hypothetical protein [Bacteroidales bacterium]